MLMMADLLAVEAWLFITVSVAGLLLHLTTTSQIKYDGLFGRRLRNLNQGI